MAGDPFEGADFAGPAGPRFCLRCGGRLETVLRPGYEHPVQLCPTCGRVHYRNAKPCAGALVVRAGHILLVRRAIEPYRGYWDIPGGFLEEGEQPQAGAVRELWEETGLEVRLGDLFGFYTDRYVYQGEQGVTLNIYFLAEVIGGEERAGDDAAELGWFGPDELPVRIAFDHARMVLTDWATRVRGEAG